MHRTSIYLSPNNRTFRVRVDRADVVEIEKENSREFLSLTVEELGQLLLIARSNQNYLREAEVTALAKIGG